MVHGTVDGQSSLDSHNIEFGQHFSIFFPPVLKIIKKKLKMLTKKQTKLKYRNPGLNLGIKGI